MASRQSTTKSKTNAAVCDSVLKLVGDHWTLAIIGSLGRREMRFCEVERLVSGINPVTLTNRLKKLQALGFLERREESVSKISVTYRLSKRGWGLIPIARGIRKFADTYH